MLKKDITFMNLDDQPVTKTFYFHLSRAELAEMELRVGGGFSAMLKRIIKETDNAKIMDTFKDIIASTVGERSADGLRFIKSPDIRDGFIQSDAFSVLFMEIASDANAGVEFINGVVPADMRGEISAQTQTIPFPGLIGTGVEVTAEPSLSEMADRLIVNEPVNVPLPITEEADYLNWRIYTRLQLLSLPDVLFDAMINLQGKNIPKDLLSIAMQRRTQGGA